MTRRFAWFTVGLSACVSFLVGMVVTGSLSPSPASSATPVVSRPVRDDRPFVPGIAGVVNFADVAERLNPAVVNIDASSRRRSASRNDGRNPQRPDTTEDPFDFRRRGETPRRGAGTGFVIDERGYILTNQHVIENAERITVKFTDGRSLRAQVIGADPDTDIALIKVEGNKKFAHATLGNSDDLRVGEWVCAIGNPLAYEHTVTVGVVSYLGRKLFDSSLDNYIQTDAAINFGNSGGPLINGRGEVVGINSAISQRASNIGFAVPINEARAILPKLRTEGRVSRGYMGVTLSDVDPDLQRSLRLTSTQGALVQDVTNGSPGHRAGLRAYDLITGIDEKRVANNNEIIREVARRGPGTLARLQVVRDGRTQTVTVRLGERPSRQTGRTLDETNPVRPSSNAGMPLGLSVRDIDSATSRRLRLPAGMNGVVVTRVDPLSSAHDAGIQRDHVVMEINRRPINSADAYTRLARAAN